MCYCGAGCYLADDHEETEPCWGAVEVIDEITYWEEGDWSWIHACQGHEEMWEYGGKYVKEQRDKQ